MDIIKKIQDAYRGIKNPKPLRIDELNMLGYIAGKKQTDLVAPAFGEGVAFQVAEVLHADTGERAGFTYLWHVRNNHGFILPESYEKYVPEKREKLDWQGKPITADTAEN